MNIFQKVNHSNFLIRLRSWEYWPFGIVQFPLFIYWLWLSLRARSLLFFTASNPSIFMGGMFGESKYDILKKTPREVTPKTTFIKVPSTLDKILSILKEENFMFPVIFKPDIGERGFMVKKIKSEIDVEKYLKEIKTDFLIQEFVDLPVECGVFYVRHPNESRGRITSLVLKEMLTITGDGRSTIQDLILAKERAKLQWNKLKETFASKLANVLQKDEVMILNTIGNHCLGTKFLDGKNLITEELTNSFDKISKQIDGFYFGRYDLRTASLEDLQAGRIKIMELNGCGAEPGHIYQPGFSLKEALKVQFQHWKDLFIISTQNHKRGVKYLTLKEGIQGYRKFKAAVQ